MRRADKELQLLAIVTLPSLAVSRAGGWRLILTLRGACCWHAMLEDHYGSRNSAVDVGRADSGHSALGNVLTSLSSCRIRSAQWP
jgi:hypothetical protein